MFDACKLERPGAQACDDHNVIECGEDLLTAVVIVACKQPMPNCDGGKCVCTGMICDEECVDQETDARHCGGCNHGCLGGTCEAGMCQPVVLASMQDRPSAIAVDDTSVYWANAGNGSINKVALGGGAVVELATMQGAPPALAISPSAVYWGGTEGLSRVPIGGGNTGSLTGGNWHAVAVNSTHVYYARTEENAVILRSGLGADLLRRDEST